MARISIGNDATIISTLTRPVQVNTGILSSAIPGARRRATVTVTDTAIAVRPIATRITPTTHRSCPTPGVFVLPDSGVNDVQASRPAPSAVNQPDCMTSPPHSQVQKPASDRRGADRRSAPTCSGTRYVAIATAIGVTNR